MICNHAGGNAELCVAAVIAAALGNVKDLRTCACGPFARLQFELAAVMETTWGCLKMPDRRLMWSAEVQSRK